MLVHGANQAVRSEQRAAVLELSVRAWAPVFPLTRSAVPEYVYDSFYPDGWKARQLADMAIGLDEEPENVDLAFDGEALDGWACTRLHPEDHMAELHVLAVDPHRQRQGVGSALVGRVYDRARAAGMRMFMVETAATPVMLPPGRSMSQPASSGGPSRATSKRCREPSAPCSAR